MVDALKSVCEAFKVTKAGVGSLCRYDNGFCCISLHEEEPTGWIWMPGKPATGQLLVDRTSAVRKENDGLGICWVGNKRFWTCKDMASFHLHDLVVGCALKSQCNDIGALKNRLSVAMSLD